MRLNSAGGRLAEERDKAGRQKGEKMEKTERGEKGRERKRERERES